MCGSNLNSNPHLSHLYKSPPLNNKFGPHCHQKHPLLPTPMPYLKKLKKYHFPSSIRILIILARMESLQEEPPRYAPSPLKNSRFSIFNQMVLKQSRSQQGLIPEQYRSKRDQPILRQPQKTKPIVWFAAILCMIFTLLVIFFGVTVLIIFLAVQPKTPAFDTPAASLTAIYFNSPQFIGNDMTFLANFSNPNRKLSVRYESLHFDLYFANRLIAAQAIQPFTQNPGEVKLMAVHLLSSLVYAPPNLAMELQKQGQRNRVVYRMKGTFRVRVNLGSVHYSYLLHSECQLEMTSPPNGILIAHNCRTKR